MAGGVMPKMVIEVPEEFTEVGKAMAEHLAALQRTVSRLGGGRAVDYAEIEEAMSESGDARSWQDTTTGPLCDSRLKTSNTSSAPPHHPRWFPAQRLTCSRSRR